MFGSHLSITGGFHRALLSAEKLGFETVQIFTAPPHRWGVHYVNDQVFTKNQKQWLSKPLEKDAIDQWGSHIKRMSFTQTVSHDSYLINLASPDEALWQKSVVTFIEELNRCVQLNIPFLVTHPGAHMGSGEDIGLARVAKGLDQVHKAVKTKSVLTCLEITAGQGTSLGYKLEHLAKVIDLCKAPERLAVCLDTAHLFAAGYDFRGKKFNTFMKEVESTIGADRIKVWHLNDSKKELGSRVDRHDHIGKGTIGLDGFKPIVRDARFKNTPKILETAKEKDENGRDWDAINLETLRGLM